MAVGEVESLALTFETHEGDMRFILNSKGFANPSRGEVVQ